MFNYQDKIAGILLHISSLPSGTLGQDAFHFVDFLSESGCRIWQTLPVNMTHQDCSPYQCISAHAGNPEFISLIDVQHSDWCKAILPDNREAALRLAYEQFLQYSNTQQVEEFEQFCTRHANWLDDFALFVSLRHHYHQHAWCDWPLDIKTRQPEAIKRVKQALSPSIASHQFTQFLFFSQWQVLKQYAAKRDIQLFGDIPIFVSYDSADVWANPEQFKLDQDYAMTVVAGVPPDYFSETGQRWGNPHYQWDTMQADGFSWWVQRMRTQALLFDILRIDHFRGLQAAWEIPTDEPTAINGQWQEAPGANLLRAIQTEMPQLKLIAEDLGIITDEVKALKDSFALPGMKILQFAFDGSEENPYLPKHISSQDVVYTGTHDNDTTLGWYQNLSQQQREIVQRYFAKLSLSDELHDLDMPYDLVRLAFSCSAFLAVIPMQDILALDGEHRMNTPGTTQGNWAWRFDWHQLNATHQIFLKNALIESGRAH
jgi:4-alpha-glucanotransferase